MKTSIKRSSTRQQLIDAARSLLCLAATAFVVFLILGARNAEWLAQPPLLVEDGRHMLAYYFGRSAPDLWRFYPEYVALGPNFLGWLATRFSATTGAYLLAWLPLLFRVLVLSSLVLPAFQHLLHSTPGRAGICIALALADQPMLLETNTTYSQWTFLLAASFLAIAQIPRSVTGTAVFVGLGTLLLLSHPLGVVLIPIFACRILFAANRVQASLTFLPLILVAVVYQIIGIRRGAVSEAIGGFSLDSSLVGTSVQLLLESLVFDGLVGANFGFRLDAAGDGAWQLWLGAVILFLFTAGVAAEIRRDGWRQHIIDRAIPLALIFLFTVASIVGRGFHDGLASRYLSVQQTLFILVALLLSARLLRAAFLRPAQDSSAASLEASHAAAQARTGLVQVGGFVLLLFWGLIFGLRTAYDYASDIGNPRGEVVLAFTQSIDLSRRMGRDAGRTFTFYDHDEAWNFSITLPATENKPASTQNAVLSADVEQNRAQTRERDDSAFIDFRHLTSAEQTKAMAAASDAAVLIISNPSIDREASIVLTAEKLSFYGYDNFKLGQANIDENYVMVMSKGRVVDTVDKDRIPVHGAIAHMGLYRIVSESMERDFPDTVAGETESKGIPSPNSQ